MQTQQGNCFNSTCPKGGVSCFERQESGDLKFSSTLEVYWLKYLPAYS